MSRIYRLVAPLVGCLLLAATASSQPPPIRGGRGGQQLLPGPRRAELLQTINQRFAQQVTREMGLTEEQTPKFQKVVAAWAQRRSALELEERRLRSALNQQLTPGVAANPDSVDRFVDGLNDNRVAYAQSFRDEMQELRPVLTPVQRGQFWLLRDRVLARVRELQQARPGGQLPLNP